MEFRVTWNRVRRGLGVSMKKTSWLSEVFYGYFIAIQFFLSLFYFSKRALCSSPCSCLPGQNFGTLSWDDVTKFWMKIYYDFFKGILRFRKGCVCSLKKITANYSFLPIIRDSSRDGCIEKIIKWKWCSGLFWAGRAAEKRIS